MMPFVEVPGIGQFGPGDMPGELAESPRELMAEVSDIGKGKGLKLSPVQMIQKVIERRKLTYQQAYDRYAGQLVQVAKKFPQHLLEVFTFLTDLRYGAYLQNIWDVVLKAQKTQGYNQWVQLYRDYALQLHEIAEWKGEQAESARDLLTELYLLQTQPGEPMEDDVDAYTGEILEKEEFVKFNENDADMDDPEMMAFIASGDFQGDFFDQDHDWVEKGEMTSATIRQNEEQELKLTEKLYELKGEVAEHLSKIREEAYKFFGQGWKEVPQSIPQDDREEWVLDFVTAKMEKADCSWDFINALNEVSRDHEPQDVFIVFTSAKWLDGLMGEIRLSSGQALDEFAEIHGDAILDYLTDPVHWKNPANYGTEIPLDDPYYEVNTDAFLAKIDEFAGNFEREYLETLPEDHPQAAQTRAFNRGMLEAIEAGRNIKDAINAGWTAWREWKSPTGAKVYEIAVSKGMDPKAAMTEFWKAAYQSGEVARPRDRIIRADKMGVTLLTGTSNYKVERHINWGIARYKASQHELTVAENITEEFKKALFGLLKGQGWNLALMTSLKA